MARETCIAGHVFFDRFDNGIEPMVLFDSQDLRYREYGPRHLSSTRSSINGVAGEVPYRPERLSLEKSLVFTRLFRYSYGSVHLHGLQIAREATG